MRVIGFDHIVLCVRDIDRTISFYERALGMQPKQERPGKRSLHFGSNKISLQDVMSAPEIARQSVPGSGNFCVLTDDPIEDVTEALCELRIEILAGPDTRQGATGVLLSIVSRS